MRPRTLVVLAVLVAALGVFIAVVERDLPGSEERREREKRVFAALEADDVDALEIEWQGATMRIERAPRADGDEEASAFPPAREWRVVAPFTARADKQLADRLAGALAGLDVERRLADAARAEVGLEPPRGRVTWRAGERQGVLEIGGKVPASSNVVVATGGGEPLVVGGTIVDDLDTPPGDWRDKQVIAAGRDQIERIRLVPAAGEEVVLARRGESFEVERPFADAADPDRVEPLLGELTALRAERFLDAPLLPEAERGLAAGPGRIELAVAGRSAPQVIDLGAEADADGRYVAVDDQALLAPTRLADELARPAAEWRSKRWAGFESWRVERLRIEDAAGALTLARDAGDWRRDGDKISYADVGDLLYAVTSARADRVLAGAEAEAVPRVEPRSTVVLADGDGGEQTLTLHGPVEGGVAARVSGRDVVLVLPETAVAELEEKLAAVRAAEPLGSAPAAGDPATDESQAESDTESEAP